MTTKRGIIMVLDGVGAGELPDAGAYGDQGSNTLGNTARAVGGLSMPNFQRLGLGNLLPIEGVPPAVSPLASYGRLLEKSPGKDTTTGHWEMAGIVMKQPFPTYPHGFPPEIIHAFEAKVGRMVLGNYPASGTEIIQVLGEEHVKTGRPIVYTSADSVFQIAAHKEVIPLDELYRMCEIARELLQGPHAVGRVIARPFIGTPGHFTRTPERRDYALPPPEPMLLDKISDAGMEVIAVGKISQIYDGRGVTRDIHATNNLESLQGMESALSESWQGLLMANLVDFDMLYGHRNDPGAFAKGLTAVDEYMPRILSLLQPGDLLIITADHGVDPTTPSTDHSREYAPLLTYLPMHSGVDLGIRDGFSDIGATMMEFLGLGELQNGRSFLRLFTESAN